MATASDWNQVPHSLRYVQPWASKYGLRGLTVYFGRRPALSKLATKRELVELRTAYETIANRGDAEAIRVWCLSIPAGDAANEVKERVRGLLLLFERLAEYDLPPFTDGKVRYISPDPPPFDWSVLPPHIEHWRPWLKKFEGLRTEWDLYEYVRQATPSQLRELRALKELIDRDGEPLRDWCASTDVKENPAKNEAFQAGWLFLLEDFARSRIAELD